MGEEPIFIVGVPRSGTTLLAAMLAAHSRMCCGPETHFFRWLAKRDAADIGRKESWPGPAVDFISSITYTRYSDGDSNYLIDKYQVKRKVIVEYLSSRQPSIAGVLSAVIEPYMQAAGKARWVEKTPDHMEHVYAIRQYFPESPIIRIMRDPRDVALSLTKVPWGAQSYLEALLYWRRFDDASAGFFDSDSRSYTVRFEDLVPAPEAELRRLCQFIGEEFEVTMLDTSMTGKQVNSRNVSWKNKASQPVDTNRIAIWRRELDRPENQMAEAMLGDRLKAYEYPRQERLDRLGAFQPTPRLAMKHTAAVEALAATGVRFWKLSANEKPAVDIYLGDPGNDKWLGENRTELLANMAAISRNLIQAAISNKTVYWVPDGNNKGWPGYCAYWLRKVLNRYHFSPDQILGS